ncbi:MAG: hypothetical protein EBY16_06310 [Gammaproteobacteria bacterium]|nr:hypothetical protein [Gammaproteobacteria bacterium]
MKIDRFIEQLSRAREQANIPEANFSKELMLSPILKWPVSDDDICKELIPKIIDIERDGPLSIEMLECWFDSNPSIVKLKKPVITYIEVGKAQRIMDSLARLLTLDERITPCVAVTIYEGQLIVASNSSLTDPLIVQGILQAKMGIIRDFLKSVRDSTPVDYDDLKKSAAEAIGKLKVISGLGNLTPKDTKRCHLKRRKSSTHLINALVKISAHFLLGHLTNGHEGFNNEQLKALLSEDILILTSAPKNDLIMHAEQAILLALTTNEKFVSFKDAPDKSVGFGISKLCCESCRKSLNEYKMVTYRGAHGRFFPRVLNINTNEESLGESTAHDGALNPSDSESDVDEDTYNSIRSRKKRASASAYGRCADANTIYFICILLVILSILLKRTEQLRLISLTNTLSFTPEITFLFDENSTLPIMSSSYALTELKNLELM